MQKILDLREFEKKQAQTELGKAVAEESRIQNTLELVAQQKVQSISSADSMSNLNELYGINQYLILLEQRKESLLTQLAQAKLVTEQKREVMKEAMQKVRVLEKLRDAREAEWKAENAKTLAKEVDDINNAKFRQSLKT